MKTTNKDDNVLQHAVKYARKSVDVRLFLDLLMTGVFGYGILILISTFVDAAKGVFPPLFIDVISSLKLYVALAIWLTGSVKASVKHKLINAWVASLLRQSLSIIFVAGLGHFAILHADQALHSQKSQLRFLTVEGLTPPFADGLTSFSYIHTTDARSSEHSYAFFSLMDCYYGCGFLIKRSCGFAIPAIFSDDHAKASVVVDG